MRFQTFFGQKLMSYRKILVSMLKTVTLERPLNFNRFLIFQLRCVFSTDASLTLSLSILITHLLDVGRCFTEFMGCPSPPNDE